MHGGWFGAWKGGSCCFQGYSCWAVSPFWPLTAKENRECCGGGVPCCRPCLPRFKRAAAHLWRAGPAPAPRSPAAWSRPCLGGEDAGWARQREGWCRRSWECRAGRWSRLLLGRAVHSAPTAESQKCCASPGRRPRLLTWHVDVWQHQIKRVALLAQQLQGRRGAGAAAHSVRAVPQHLLHDFEAQRIVVHHQHPQPWRKLLGRLAFVWRCLHLVCGLHSRICGCEKVPQVVSRPPLRSQTLKPAANT